MRPPPEQDDFDTYKSEERKPDWLMRLLASAAALIAIGLLYDQCTVEADAHDAPVSISQPLGWSYPFACCSGVDCRAVSSKAVREMRDGYVVPSGEAIAMSDSRIRPSPDGEYHWCSVAGKDDGRTICLFVPDRGF